MTHIKKTNVIKKLSPYQHVRKRTEMYFGSRAPHTQIIFMYDDKGEPYAKEVVWTPAAYTYLREILDNSMDELIGHNHGNRIDVTYDPVTYEFSVEDNGRGIPVTYDQEHKCYTPTMVVSHLMTGRNFDDREEVGGTNGIGAKGVNFCSEYFKLVIHNDGKVFKQSFEEMPVGFDEQLQTRDPIIKTTTTTKTGTKIIFKPSKHVFDKFILPEDFVKSRLMDIAYSNPKLSIYYNGHLIKTKNKVEQNFFINKKPITIPIIDGTTRTTFYLLPNWMTEGEMIHSLVNNIPVFDGGVHIDMFRRVFFGNLLTALDKESKKRKLNPNRNDVVDGLLLFNITNMFAPNFNSQAKTRLINEDIGITIKKQLDNPELYKDIIKKNKEWIDVIYERCASRTLKKDASDTAKMAKKVLRNKVPRLTDANATDRSKCILLLAEGLSAIGGALMARDPEIHGGLGLRGKVLNVNGESPKKILDNMALCDIMNAIGLIIGERANRHALRYGKVYIAADADPDGLNITALLINFFHTYWPELFDNTKEPFIYIFMTPFIIADKGKQRKYWYANDYHEFNPKNYKGWSITRAKGLGTLNEEDWKCSLANPVVMPILDDGKMQESLDLIFNGTKADLRKEWIGL